MPSWLMTGIFILFSASLLAGFFYDTLKFSMMKQFIGITYSAIAYYCLFSYVNFDLKRLFKIYLICAVFVAALGCIEQAMHMAGMHQYFSVTKRVSLGFYRVYSIMGEPYFLAVALIPALHYYLNRILGTKASRSWKDLIPAGIVLACYYFTFSSAGVIGLGLMLIILMYNHNVINLGSGRVVFLPIFILLFISFYDNIMGSFKEFQVRIEDTVKAFLEPGKLTQDEVDDLNSSTFALYSNFTIAQKNFETNPIIGTGLGSHQIAYDKFFGDLFGEKFLIMYGKFNAKDANSMFIRLMSETGILGLAMVIGFALLHFNFRRGIDNKEKFMYTLMNQAVFIVIIVRLARTGNYIGQGFFFFVFLYYYSKILANRPSSKKSIAPKPQDPTPVVPA